MADVLAQLEPLLAQARRAAGRAGRRACRWSPPAARRAAARSHGAPGRRLDRRRPRALRGAGGAALRSARRWSTAAGSGATATCSPGAGRLAGLARGATGCGRATRWPSSPTAARRWCRRCWGCSRPARPSWCSTPPIRRRGWSRCSRLAAPRAWIALEAAGPVPGPVRDWLEAAGCPCLELPAGGAAALESVAAFAAGAPRWAAGPQDVAVHRLHLRLDRRAQGDPRAARVALALPAGVLPREFELGPDDRFSMLSGLSHDPLQRDIFTPLFLGATIVVPDPADIGIAGRLAEWMNRERVTVANLTPALGQLLTELPPGGETVGGPQPAPRDPGRRGADAPRRRPARAMAPEVTCINLYGSTETQRALGIHRVSREESEALSERARQVLPLGRGIEDAQLLVINRAGGLAGIGEIGEIAMRSPHLARGYLGNEALTGRAVPAQPVHRRGRGPDLPHRRPRALPARRRGGVRRPLGLPGQAAGLPHRAGGDRGGAGAPSGRARGGGAAAPGPAGRRRAGGLRRPHRRGLRRAPPSCTSTSGSACRPTWCRRRSSSWSRCR